MSIETEIDRLEGITGRLQIAKAAIMSAINAKGGSATGHGFEDFASDIATIPSGMKVAFFSISLTDSTIKLPVDTTPGTTEYFELDFEPKGVLYFNENTVQNIRQHLPTVSGKTVRGYSFGCYFPIAFFDSTQDEIKKRCYVTNSEASNSSLSYMVSSSLPISKNYNTSTGKYDVFVGDTEDGNTLAYRFIGWQGAQQSELIFFG